jgi:hypothetical protein
MTKPKPKRKDEMFEDTQTNMDLMARGFKQLFKGESYQEETTSEMNTEQTIKIHPIKNQNIFVNIKKKV